MDVRRSLVALGLLTVLPASALAWSYDRERGVDLYRTPPGQAVVSLVCDPEGVYGGDESAILAELGGDVDHTGSVVFRFAGGDVIETEMTHGRIGKRDIAASVWADLLAGLRSNDAFTVERGSDVYAIPAGEPTGFTCV